jgi:UDP-glucose 4-epimerase
MKRILITGANSYIGTSFENWVKQWPDKYSIETLDIIDDAWREKSFVGFDAVFHVAGIAHIKETKKNAPLYYKINRDLAIETAQKAKIEDVKQFIVLSSMSVYGLETGEIDKDTEPNPKTNYGKSKLEADIQLAKMSDGDFRVCIVRPPMVYGKGCKGNYQILSKVARILPIFPDVENRRSMIYISNLTEFIRQLIDESAGGVFLPQDSEYVCTSKMLELIANAHGRQIRLFKPFSRLISRVPSGFIKKVFGTLTYHIDLREYMNNPIKTLEEAIQLTES